VDVSWTPSRTDPLLILAMDHRGSFGKSLFGVQDDEPTPQQRARMVAAKELIHRGLVAALDRLPVGRRGVLVDERYGQSVIDAARSDGLVLAVPVEASGHDWFTLEWGNQWLDHVRRVAPDHAKVLVRDNPDFDVDDRRGQLERLAQVCVGLREVGVPLIYELLVPATDAQLAQVDGDSDRYDRERRPALVAQVIADNQAAGVEPALWKVEGLDTVDGAQVVAAQARAGDRAAQLIVLGRDAPDERVNTWLDVATQVDGFVGFAIGRSIWEQPLTDWAAGGTDSDAVARITRSYLGFATRWADAVRA
jgi:myo-inositol catabolism protein IolC